MYSLVCASRVLSSSWATGILSLSLLSTTNITASIPLIPAKTTLYHSLIVKTTDSLVVMFPEVTVPSLPRHVPNSEGDATYTQEQSNHKQRKCASKQTCHA